MTRSAHYHRQRSCLNKVRHETYDEARERFAGKVRRGEVIGLSSSIYRCTFCNGYHLGRAPKSLVHPIVANLYSEITEGQRDWWPLMDGYCRLTKSLPA